MKSVKRIKQIGLATAGVIVVGLALLHLRYPLPYVYRVIAYRGPDYSDIQRFPSRAVEPSSTPRAWPTAIDPRVAAILEQSPAVDRLDTFLQDTDTTSFLVVHHGQIVEERYLQGDDRGTLQNSFSVSKSFTSALIGLAVQEGVLEFDAPITRYVPELERRDARFADITVENLLDMRSGIRYSSDIAFPFITADSALIYYSTDLEAVVTDRLSISGPPGEFQYNNYNPPLLGLILRRTTGLPAARYLERSLWQPLGATGRAGWTIDDRGFERMESGFHASARDLARLGQMYLDGGKVDGRLVLPAAWTEDTTTGTGEPWELDAFNGRSWGYRAGWWLVPRPSGAEDYCAIGHFGQFIYVSPQHDAVFVRTGPGRGKMGDRDWTELFYFAAERLGTPAFDATARAAVYTRGDRIFGEAQLWSPLDDPDQSSAFLLAPLIVHEIDGDDPAAHGGFGHVATDGSFEVRDGEPTVFARRSSVTVLGEARTQWTYAWWYAPARMRGLRMTLAADGFPMVYEILGDTMGARPIFVTRPLDEAAAARFGPPLDGRSFAIERTVADAPDVVVLDTVEPGPTPLGPFVYLAPDSRNAVALHCRCTPSRMAAVTGNVEYRLVVRDALPTDWPVEPRSLETLLRLPATGW